MYKIIDGSTQGLADLERFVETLGQVSAEAAIGFDPRREVFITRAPGRLDVMGGIADYSGSLVLQLPVSEAAIVALQPDPSPELTIVSVDVTGGRRCRLTPLSLLFPGGNPIECEAARRYFERDPSESWAAYIAGAFLVLSREVGARFNRGARILVASSVPEGKGVSSSAALEVASMEAVAAAFDIQVQPREMALLCQKVENHIVGAPCGVMDQMTAVCGEAGRLLALLCQPADVLGTIGVPPSMGLWGLDSGVRHFVSGADYGSVRTGAFMGYRMICDIAGLDVRETDAGLAIDDSRWGGYLANVTPREFESEFASGLPERMKGSEFLSRYGAITDTATRIKADRTYPVLAATAHPIYEHTRVQKFAELLRDESNDPTVHRLVSLGELMYESHASYSACGLGADGTDLLVKLVQEAGPAAGLYGGKITGGGSGGTVAVLGASDARESVEAVAEKYEQATGVRPHIFEGSSPGSTAVGFLRVVGD
ncbi:MAG TPA: GHMP kinase [Blastocatellia bacterium]|jgi:L-arabinokinase|nr:GHMP kinase [Blastocatellia bacterium]